MSELAYGYCGMPCSLCPHYHTKGESRCKGCSTDGFFTGSCGIYKCCKKDSKDHCALCREYPCKKCSSLKEFSSFNTNKVWLRTAVKIQKNGFESWYREYQKKAELIEEALERYNNGRMKQSICSFFVNHDLEQIEMIMSTAKSFEGDKKELALQFKKLLSEQV